MVRRALVLAVAVGGAVLGLTLLAAPDDDQPLAVVGHTGVSAPPSTTTAPVPTTAAAAAPPATTRPTAVSNRSSTLVRSESGGISMVRSESGGVTVVNSGSAVASTGGNTVIGPPDATVIKGPASAVGNSSEVGITRP